MRYSILEVAWLLATNLRRLANRPSQLRTDQFHFLTPSFPVRPSSWMPRLQSCLNSQKGVQSSSPRRFARRRIQDSIHTDRGSASRTAETTNAYITVLVRCPPTWRIATVTKEVEPLIDFVQRVYSKYVLIFDIWCDCFKTPCIEW